uniref:NADH dehydrogenase subunit 2 n=1 Tax=Trichuris rhinopiptheroxella TaxID=2282176 RepID=A0A346HH50_9BILA|nr:NADH dehydrogenase subunit 2 [Trichuris rhinopiptheroxella]
MMHYAWYLLYVTLAITSTSMSNWLSVWTMLELSAWIMIILTMPNSGIIYDSMFKMYLMLSLSSMMLVLLWLYSKAKNEWMLSILAFKMGLPPLHWWVGWAMKNMAWKTMWWFTTIHKLIPMIITLTVISSMLIFYWCIICFMWSSISFWLSTSYFLILLYSSCIHSNWLWMTIPNLNTFLTYFLIYTSIMFYIFMKTKNSVYWAHDTSFAWAMAILLGVPTSMVFFLKLITMAAFINTMSLIAWFLMWINIITILPYTRMVWNSYTNSMNDPNKYPIKLTSYNTHLLVLSQYILWACVL